MPSHRLAYQAPQISGFCTINVDGTVYCWRDNYYGQLGNGERGYSAVPVTVKDLP